ncbi:nucleotide sugar dehydrogenase, partial [Candidatus Pelagibacter ubique]|nr:nucleotide sugar dehydrogenase [Candidatus Pelagibacter ubique]
MKIGIIGAGFVGLVTGACIASRLNNVTCIDSDKKKIANLNNRIIPIYEVGLEKLIKTKINQSLYFKDNLSSLNSLDLLFVTVGTPLVKQKILLNDVEKCIQQILKNYNSKKKILIVIKSTIPPGTTEYLYKKYFKKFKNLSLINNPEFLREGSAVKDFQNPDRIIIGYKNKRDLNKIIKIYKKYKTLIFKLTYEESEISKYYSNSFFALLISFSNQFSQLCDYLPNTDLLNINKTLLADRRISINGKVPQMKNYLVPGIGFGGSCFPKDVGGINSIFKYKKINSSITNSILEVNEKSLKHCVQIIKKKIKRNQSICILGAS